MFARLTDEQEAIRDVVREFAQKEIAPHADQWDEEHSFPREIFRPLAEMGLAGLLAPEDYGGSQLSRLTGALIYEELGKADMAHRRLALRPQHGDWHHQPLRRRGAARALGSALAAGELLGAFSLSEAHAGSDAANLQCAARRDGDDYILNGSKFWVTNAGVADLYVVMARTGGSGSRGVSAFVVEQGHAGLQHRQDGAQDGPARFSPPASCSSRSAVFPPRTGWARRARASRSRSPSLDGGRINIGAIAPAWPRPRSKWRRRYARERQAFGKPIGAFEGIQFMLADMAMKIEASRLLVYEAAFKMDDGDSAATHTPRWRSASPPTRRWTSRPTPCRCWAARATCATGRWNATCAT